MKKKCLECNKKLQYHNKYGYCREHKNLAPSLKQDVYEYKKQWALNNKEKIAKYDKKYKTNNKIKVKKRLNKWKEKNPDYYKEYRLTHKKQHSTYIYKYYKKKRQKDPLFRLRWNLRNRLKNMLKVKSWHKDNKTADIIGCTLEELKYHIESKFTQGMTWQNYGKWELDHIIPVSKATTKEELYKLNHYSNLQPLWKLDNIKKSNK